VIFNFSLRPILNQDGWTALMAASNGNHAPVAELLLKKHADINMMDKVIRDISNRTKGAVPSRLSPSIA
jgi:ankyrin repeat protein